MGESNNGIGFFGMLIILFIGLKITDYIDWSWWWVLSPLWLPLLVVILVLVLLGVLWLVWQCIVAIVEFISL